MQSEVSMGNKVLTNGKFDSNIKGCSYTGYTHFYSEEELNKLNQFIRM